MRIAEAKVSLPRACAANQLLYYSLYFFRRGNTPVHSTGTGVVKQGEGVVGGNEEKETEPKIKIEETDLGFGTMPTARVFRDHLLA